MLTRRQFHLSVLASLAATTLPRPALAAPAADLWLNRLTFGATPEDRTAFADPMAWLEDQLSRPADDPGLTGRLAAARLRINYDAGSDENGRTWQATNELRPLGGLQTDPATHLHCIDWEQGMEFSERIRPAQEVIAASLIRAVHAPAQLREMMTQFWHDHFSVNALKDEFTAAFFPSYDRVMRTHAFGNFRALLGAMARSPAMLYSLNNADSRASPANENFARELLELHTLGASSYLNDRYDDWHSVPKDDGGLAQGYLDLDVYEVARAFTGWSVGDGRWLSEGTNAPKTGAFHYIEAWHDPYQKRILGIEFPPNRAAMADGDQVLDMLAVHPGTARFVCAKIARRLLTDHPDPGLVQDLAAVFLAAKDAPDQIAQVIRALVGHPAFTATPPGKLRRPFEFLAALYRATGAQITGTENSQHYQLIRAGWRQHEYGPPTGHPDTIDKWTGASSLNRLIDFALAAHEDWFAVASLDLAAVEIDETAGAFLLRWAGRLGVSPADLAQSIGVDPATPSADLSADERKGMATAAIAFAALTPQFLLR
jgi:uncharacterized protein (DUF1800 family)